MNRKKYDGIIIEIQVLIDDAIKSNSQNEQWFLEWLDKLNALSIIV